MMRPDFASGRFLLESSSHSRQPGVITKKFST